MAGGRCYVSDLRMQGAINGEELVNDREPRRRVAVDEFK